MHHRLYRGFASLLAVPAALLAGCNKEPATAPRIVSLSIVSGLGQSSFVGALLPAPFVVRAADQDGVPVPGVKVNWSVASGGGTVSPAETVSDADGIASTTYRLGATLGQQTVQAAIPGGQPVTFTANASAAPASQISIVSGDDQTGVVRTTLPGALTVKVSDAFGNAKEGITVFFTVLLGNGTLSSSTAVSSATGIASVTWTLGPLASTQRVSATIPGVAPAIFDATALPGPPALVVLVSGNNQVAQPGALLPDSLVVRVTDQYENPVKDVSVAWVPGTDAGTVSPATGKTDLVGRAATSWTLGATSGPKEIRATVQGIAPATFRGAGTIVFATVMVGGHHSCGIDIGGAAFCWGFNDVGQLGIGSVTPGSGPAFANLFPNTVVDGRTFSTTFGGASGSDHTCAITLQKTMYCWGFNADGRLGNGQSGVDLKSPRPVAVTLPDFRTVSAGASHTCGLTSANRLFCWGSNAVGKLGIGSSASSFPTPQAVAQGLSFSSVAAGGLHSCAVTTVGDLYCWGSNEQGQAGLVMAPGSDLPAQVPGTQFAQVAAGDRHTCALGQAGELYCWGDNQFGQLGDGTNTAHNVPTLVPGYFFASITAGQHHTCGLTSTGIAYCWGLGTTGQLGNNAFESSNEPVTVFDGHTFSTLSAGGNQTCGVSDGNVIYCWGDNQYGALGDGTQTNRSRPTKVAYQP